MAKIASKPNTRGIKKVSDDIQYRTQLIGRDSRLTAGLAITRVAGIAIGVVAALVIVGIPLLLL